ncbi:ribbon-helix-helix domain-containing protein [Methylobacterium sp. SI9]|uniref:ribbon-helix-helix domain-containing protein n=1 Tax=Methylobacterium guangdongense TaxID=3138811 RepID=UPI00313E659E
MSKKPSFANLGARLASKPAGAPSEATSAVETMEAAHRAEAATVAGRSARQPDGRKGILVRARPEAWKALKLIALDGERTLQDVMTEAINDVLAKNGKPPVA